MRSLQTDGCVSGGWIPWLTAMMAQIPWEIEQVIYLDENHAIIETSTSPTLNRIACRQNDDQMVIMHIKAVNSNAVKAFREVKIPFRTLDPKVDDQVISDVIRRTERQHEGAEIENVKTTAQTLRMQESSDVKTFAEVVVKSSYQKREHAMSSYCDFEDLHWTGLVWSRVSMSRRPDMLMLVMLRYLFFSGDSSHFCVIDNEANTLMFLFPISFRSIPKWSLWSVVLMMDYTFSRKQMRTSTRLFESSLSWRLIVKVNKWSPSSLWGVPAVISNNDGIDLMCDRRFHVQVKRMSATTTGRKQWQDATRLELFRGPTAAPQRHATDKSIMWLFFIVVYGVVGIRLETDRLLREVDTWVKEIVHNYPLFVVGNFNIELWTVKSSWSEQRTMLYIIYMLHGRRSAAFSRDRQSIIGGSITSASMRSHEREWRVFSVEDIFATHRSLRMRLHLAAFTQQKLMRHKAAPLDTTSRFS